MVDEQSYPAAPAAAFADLPWQMLPLTRQLVDLWKGLVWPGYHLVIDAAPAPDDQGPALAREIRERTIKLFGLALVRDFPEPKARKKEAERLTDGFLAGMGSTRDLLATDLSAAIRGDPATERADEIMLCYPSLVALSSQRLAHSLYQANVPLIPRIMTELAHAATGIDIHPGAKIGSHCFIDHGTGVVIGQTAIVGNRVLIYQGVTLGSRSFPKDESGKVIKGAPRHPIIEDDVVIYAGATVLGRITIGRGSAIGGNVWVTRDVPPQSRVTQSQYRQESFNGYGEGI